jgi:hypothetical protein
MAEQRQKSGVILLEIRGKTPVRIELYDASEWDHPAAVAGLFRLRVDGKWLRGDEDKYRFVPADQVVELVREHLAGRVESPGRKPRLVPGMRVRVPGDNGGRALTTVMAGPIQGPDRRWRVFVVGSREPVLCDQVEAIR